MPFPIFSLLLTANAVKKDYCKNNNIIISKSVDLGCLIPHDVKIEAQIDNFRSH